eukprot:1065216-Alexandrium_andersonii.AAC.1
MRPRRQAGERGTRQAPTCRMAWRLGGHAQPPAAAGTQRMPAGGARRGTSECPARAARWPAR